MESSGISWQELFVGVILDENNEFLSMGKLVLSDGLKRNAMHKAMPSLSLRRGGAVF